VFAQEAAGFRPRAGGEFVSMRWALTVALAAAACALASSPVLATWPGANGRIAFETSGELRSSTLAGRHERVLARFPPLPFGVERKSGFPEWRPDGARVLYQRMATGIETVGDDGRGRRTLRTSLLFPGWSPNGRELVAVEAEPEPYALVRLRRDGSHKRRFAVPPVGSLALPRWSPSGRWILFEHGTSEGRSVWRVRPDGSGMRRIVPGKLHTWAPDGRRFAYTDGRDIWSIRADGGGRRRVLRCPADTTVAGMAWSPDGRRIAFVRQIPADAHDTSTVMTVPAGGGRATRHFGGERFIGVLDWQPR
jgi:dipeptidyl aminopeptidase/acylaminoacyl peptidase